MKDFYYDEVNEKWNSVLRCINKIRDRIIDKKFDELHKIREECLKEHGEHKLHNNIYGPYRCVRCNEYVPPREG